MPRQGGTKMEQLPPFPDWDPANPDQSLQQIYRWVVAYVQAQIAWYQRCKCPKRSWSQWLRGCAIIFAAAGTLCPLLGVADLFGAAINKTISQLGYVFLALSAAIVGYDKYFGLSSSWMRFIVTQVALEKALAEFQLDWALLQAAPADSNQPKTDIPARLQRIKTLTSLVHGLIKQEMDSWIIEFQNSIAQLDKTLKRESERGRREDERIRVTLANATPRQKLLLNIDGAPPKPPAGPEAGQPTRDGPIEVPANGSITISLAPSAKP